MAKVKPSKRIPSYHENMILDVNPSDITVSLMQNWFLDKIDPSSDSKNVKKRLFNVNDILMIPANKFHNKKELISTPGIYIMNKLILSLSDEIVKIFNGYINKPIDGKTLNIMGDILAMKVYKSELDHNLYIDYLDKVQFIGGNNFAKMLGTTLSPGLLTASTKAKRLKKELLKVNEEAIKNGDAIVATDIISKIMSQHIKDLEDMDPQALETLNAKSKIGTSDLSKMIVMAGPAKDPASGEYDIITSSLGEGIGDEEIAVHTNQAVFGTFSRSMAVAVSGYMANQSNKLYSNVKIALPGTDCKTKRFQELKLFPFLKQECLFKFIKNTDGSLLLLTEDNIDKYIGKTVQMRALQFCQWDDKNNDGSSYCSVCAGKQPEYIGIRKVGNSISRLSNTLVQKNLKRFHKTTIDYTDIHEDDLIHWRN